MTTRAFSVPWLPIGGFLVGCFIGAPVLAGDVTAPQWGEVELTFTAENEAANPYTDVDA